MTTTPSKKEEQREATEAEQRRQRDYQDALAEIAGMSGAYAALHQLPADAQDRALRWLDARLNAERVHVHIDPYKDEEPPF